MDFSDKLVFVAGGGFFGKKASKWFKKRDARVLLVDIDPDSAKNIYNERLDGYGEIGSVDKGEIGFLVGDAVEIYLDIDSFDISIVVPAVPGHFVGKLIKIYLEKQGFNVIPDPETLEQVLKDFNDRLVYKLYSEEGVLVSSYMQKGRCMDDCPQPKDECPATGKQKIGDMNKLIKEVLEKKVDYSRVVVSHNINGAGYINNKNLDKIIQEVKSLGENDNLAIATSCSCHGILNILKLKSS